MATFGDYALYYNLFYRDKPYEEESAFVLSLLEAYGTMPRTALDLGCGTGRHAQALARRGIAVTGVDMSETMVSMGRRDLSAGDGLVDLEVGDARSARLGTRFDAVVSLFHVLSYQLTEADCIAFMRTAAAHLDPGGLFLADFWYGPGVLRLRPEEREKILEEGDCLVERKATPTLDTTRDQVAVRYDIRLKLRASGRESAFSEEHRMRYWFLPELRHLAGEANLKPLADGAWLKTDAPTEGDWAAWMLFRKK